MAKREERQGQVFAHVRISAPAAAGENAVRWPQALEICGDYSPRVREVTAGGEALLDLTGTERLIGNPLAVGREIRSRLRGIGLDAAIGLGPTAAVARLASHAARSGEVLEIGPEQASNFLSRLPVEALPGVDGDWARWLREMGLGLAGDLAALSEEAVARTLGARGVELWKAARGEDPPQAEEASPTPGAGCAPDSVAGAADLFPATGERAEVRAALREAAEQAAQHLRSQGKVARQVCLEIVSRDLRRVELRRTLILPARSGRTIYAVASMLFDRLQLRGLQVRRVRVRAARLVLDARGGQLALPMADGKARPGGQKRRTRMNADIRG